MYADSFQLGAPGWSAQSQRRLFVSCVMSAFCIATVVLVLRFPVAEQSRPFTELLVQILAEEVKPDVPPQTDARTAEQSIEPAAEPAESPQEAQQEAAENPALSRDWYALIPEAVSSTLDSVPRQYSINPVFDEKRRLAATKFRPSNAPRKTPIWENVEKDALGRTLLWAGDCYRVLDDPNVGNRDAYEIFGQYMVTCLASSDTPKLLPWVKEIQSRRANQARYGRPAAE